LDPPCSYAERAFWCSEKSRFGLQRSDNELTSETRHFVDETLQSFGVELRCRVIEQQGWSGLGEVLQEADLRDSHRDRDEFLLPPREHIARRPAVEPDGNVGPMGSGLCLPPQLVGRA
jgi:hypothetical protein